MLVPEAIHRVTSGDVYEDKLLITGHVQNQQIALYQCRSPKGEEYIALVQERPLPFGLKKEKVLATAKNTSQTFDIKYSSNFVQFNKNRIEVLNDF